MKKLITFLAVAALLASMLVLPASAEQTNMEVNAPKFTKAPTLDGVITVEEWGERTVHVRTDYASTVDDETIGYDPEYDVRNIFYWFELEGVSDSLCYDLWIRWDDDYLYVAAIVEDPDPFALAATGYDIWNGDMFQFKVDTAGPSAKMFEANEDFDYKKDSFNGARFPFPWSEDPVFNTILGLSYGDTPTAWMDNGVISHEMIQEGGAILGVNLVINPPATEDGYETCTISYEVAVPWAEIDELFVPKAGSVIGMCAVACSSDCNVLSAWLQWGHGICSVTNGDPQPRGTRGGSQAVVLVDDETVTPADSYETAEPVTAEPEATNAAGDAGDETNAPAATDPADNNADDKDDAKDTAKAPAQNNNSNANNTNKNNSTVPIGVIVGIIAAVVVVIAAVVIVVVKKKK